MVFALNPKLFGARVLNFGVDGPSADFFPYSLSVLDSGQVADTAAWTPTKKGRNSLLGLYRRPEQVEFNLIVFQPLIDEWLAGVSALGAGRRVFLRPSLKESEGWAPVF